MNIWIVNYYCSIPEFDTHGRHLAFAAELMRRGHKVTVIMPGSHGMRNYIIDFHGKAFERVQYGEYSFIHIKCCNYEGNGLRRMFSIFQYGLRILRNRKKWERPDVIIHNIHAPFDYLVTICAKKLKARYIVEQWDLWPDNFVTYGFLSAKNPIMKWAYWIERKMFESGDEIIHSMPGGLMYLREHGWTDVTGGIIKEAKVHYINNGVSLTQFNKNKETAIVNDTDLINPNTFKLVYLGSIRFINNVRRIIDTMSYLKEKEDIVLLIYGDGNEREELVQYCEQNSINNVKFKEKRLPYAQCAYVLSHANINILNYTKGFARHGISAGKFMISLAAGKPMICNVKIAYSDLITENGLGICDNLETPEAYANAIRQIYELPQELYEEMCVRVTETASSFDYQVLSNKFANVIENKYAETTFPPATARATN